MLLSRPCESKAMRSILDCLVNAFRCTQWHMCLRYAAVISMFSYEIDLAFCPGKMPSTVQDVLVSAIRLLRGKAAPECHNAVAAKPVENLLRVLGMRQMGSSIWAAVPDEQAAVNASNSFSAATVVFAAQTGSYMYNLHTATSDKDFKVSWRLVDWNQHQLGCRLCIIPLQQSLHHSVGGGLRSGSSSMLLLLQMEG